MSEPSYSGEGFDNVHQVSRPILAQLAACHHAYYSAVITIAHKLPESPVIEGGIEDETGNG
jgi:hypothetical protein